MPIPSPTEAQIESTATVRIARRAARYYLQGYHRVQILTPSMLPPTGPAILVSNHISGLDPVILQDAIPDRLIHWMMAREYYEIPALKWVYQSVHAIPVERSGKDLAATRLALRTLADGKVLGIFPEGRIDLSGQVLPFQTGVALLAVKSGAPVCPIYLEGSVRNTEMVEAFMEPHQIAMAFGPPLSVPDDSSREALEQVSRQIHAAVCDLRAKFFPLLPACR